MAKSTRFFLRIPLILFALGNLVLLGQKLQPWQEIHNLPEQGATAYDPLICLAAYLILFFWIGSTRSPEAQKALTISAGLAIPAGLLAIGYVLLDAQQGAHNLYAQIGVLALASLFPGIAGYKTQKLTKSPNVGIVAGAWSGMVSALMAVAVILARLDPSSTEPLSNDPWKQYEGLAIGNQAIQNLVHSLNLSSCFLLIAPLVGGVLALFFALSAQE